VLIGGVRVNRGVNKRELLKCFGGICKEIWDMPQNSCSVENDMVGVNRH